MSETVERIGPAMVWPLASFIAEEMEARKWTAVDVARRLPGDYGKNVIIVNLLLAVQDEKMILTDELLGEVAKAFGVSAEMFEKLHADWLRWPSARQPFECPEHILDGLLMPANDPTPSPEGNQR